MPFSASRPSRRNCAPARSAMCWSTWQWIGRGRSISAACSPAIVSSCATTRSKRVLRAILKTTDLCASDPARAARMLVDSGFTPRYDYALQTLRDNPYDKWREYDPEDTLRFYALRMREAGFVKSSPQKIIADGTDWRFLDELKRELKA